jgi:hypothetical protein
MNTIELSASKPREMMTETRTLEMSWTCHSCGKRLPPQMVTVHFESYHYKGELQWRVRYYTCLNGCEEK